MAREVVGTVAGEKAAVGMEAGMVAAPAAEATAAAATGVAATAAATACRNSRQYGMERFRIHHTHLDSRRGRPY